MTQSTTTIPGLKVTLTAHREASESLLMIEVAAEAAAQVLDSTPVQVALVIDRSGSMSGQKLEIAKEAVSRFVRSLGPTDRVAVVAYDDSVDLIAGLQAPSEQLARQVERLSAGGSTDLYGGWLMGAKLVGNGGRVILLSDGQANVGRFTDAASLGHHAGISLRKFGVTTSTVGVGNDYDEALMAGMAQRGGGAHYFAHNATAILDAFGQERYSADAIRYERVELTVGNETFELGHFWGGETKRRVIPCSALSSAPAALRFTTREDRRSHALELPMPTAFGHDEGVRLEWLFQQAADAEGRMVEVRDPKTAKRMREVLRAILLKLLAHPSADGAEARSVIERLQASVERLAQLELVFREEDAVLHRKRSMQQSYNLRERAKAFTSFEDDREAVLYAAQAAQAPVVEVTVRIEPAVFALASRDKWIAWRALPVAKARGTVTVALEDPRDGIVTSEIGRALGLPVRAVFAGVSSAEIVRMLERQ